MWVLRLSILAASVISCSIALSGASIYYLSVVCSDVVYVTLFPQLVLVVHGANHVNSYGCLSSVVIGILLRITGGEPNLGLPALIKYPWYDYQLQQQLFPFKTMAMLLSAASHLLISKLAAIVFEKKLLSTERWDVLNAFPDVKTKKTLEGTNNMGFS
ncbi:high-affinity choline transporter 1-like isoform X3 [Diaphorina citri]|uniref:High-affinity choline transporter 1-like isoform X3 n=1 Tax=Diaphorina citri TaxID=121845 RepID=A0A1S4EMM8_DIACI|nr:high-affinity choline transporter 1-like isoform X3 [Diaphorina citri]